MTLHTSFKAVFISSLLALGAFAADPKNDHQFVEDAAGGGLAEVKLSQLAVDRSSNATVKDFAQTMVTEHTKANDELRSLADGRTLMLPTELPKNAQKTWDDLNNLSGDKFDKAYADVLVDDHKKTVKLFEKEAKHGEDATLKAWAAKTLPTLQHHLEMAIAVQKSVKTPAGK